MRDTFIEVLHNAAESDERILLLTADLGFKVFDNFTQQFPERFINVGVAEQNLIGLAAGLASQGWRPVVYSIGNFPTLRCYEQIRLDLCYANMPVLVVTVGAGFSYGALGVTHHATEDLGAMRALPNMLVVSPSDLGEVRELGREVLTFGQPTYLRLDKSAAHEHPSVSCRLGAPRLLRTGRDVTIFSHGSVRAEAESAAAILASAGIDAGVVSVHTLTQVDEKALLDLIVGRRLVVTLEEHVVAGGLASLLCDLVATRGIGVRVLPLGLHAEFARIVGSQDFLRSYFGLDAESVAAKIVSACV